MIYTIIIWYVRYTFLSLELRNHSQNSKTNTVAIKDSELVDFITYVYSVSIFLPRNLFTTKNVFITAIK